MRVDLVSNESSHTLNSRSGELQSVDGQTTDRRVNTGLMDVITPSAFSLLSQQSVYKAIAPNHQQRERAQMSDRQNQNSRDDRKLFPPR